MNEIFPINLSLADPHGAPTFSGGLRLRGLHFAMTGLESFLRAVHIAAERMRDTPEVHIQTVRSYLLQAFRG